MKSRGNHGSPKPFRLSRIQYTEKSQLSRGPRTHRIALAAALLLALLHPVASAEDLSAPPDSGKTFLAFVSDTQSPNWIERLLFGANWIERLLFGGNRNEEATDSIFAELSRSRPRCLFVLGDLVSFGAYGRSWNRIEEHIKTLRRAGVPVHAILGNHELMFFPHTGEENFQKLFPGHVPTGFVETVDSVAVVLLNSNFSTLGREGTGRQREWYQKTLDSLQGEPAVLDIVVCCHHSPFTNSRVVAASEEVRKEFVPGYLATPKCRLFLSGHAHACEEFPAGGKTFLVIGGGGGANQPLYEGDAKKWNDLAPSRKPLFHYLELRREGKTLVATVRGLSDDMRRFSDFIRVVLPEPGPDSQRATPP